MEHVCISPPYQILVVGDVASKEFHAACSIIQDEYRQTPKKFHKPIIKPLFEYKWLEYLCAERKRIGKAAWRTQQPVFIYANGCLIGDLSDLVKSGRKMGYLFKTINEKESLSAYQEYMSSFKRHFVYMDISIEERPIGRLKFMLYSEELPDTCRRFADLCRGMTEEEEEKEAKERARREKIDAKEKAGEKTRASMEWVGGEWRPKQGSLRWGRCAPARRNWEDLREIIEEEVQRVCPEEDRMSAGEEEAELAAMEARSWYRDHLTSHHRWKRESLLRVSQSWWRKEGRPDGEEEEDEESKAEPWRRPVMHLGGVVVHDGTPVMHVQGVVMPHEWPGGPEEDQGAVPEQQYATHVGGIVVHDGEPVVHVQGIVGHGHWEGRREEEMEEITPEPGHVVHVGGIVIHDGKSVMHVEGIEARGVEHQGDGPEHHETDQAMRGGSIVQRDGKSVVQGRDSIVPRDGRSVVHAEGDIEPDALKEKEKGEDTIEDEDNKAEVQESGGGEMPQPEEKESGENEETEKKEEAEKVEEEAKEGENVEEQEKTEKVETEEGETKEGDTEEQEKHEEGETKEGDEKGDQEKKEEEEIKDGSDEKQEERKGEDQVGDEVSEAQEQKQDDDGKVKEYGGEENQVMIQDVKDTAEDTIEEDHQEILDAPPPMMHLGGIVVHEGEGVMHVHGVVEQYLHQQQRHGGKEKHRDAEEPTSAVHVGGIVVHEGEPVVHIEGIVEHGHWEKPTEEAPEAPPRTAVHIGGIVVHEGEPVVHVQGIVEHGGWEEAPEPPKEPARAVHVGGIAIHDGEPVVHVQGIVEYERWDEEEEPPWPEPGHVVHVGRIVMHDGRPVVHVEGVVAQEQPEPGLAPGHVMHLGGMVTCDGEEVMLCHGVVDHSEWDKEPELTWERMMARGFVEHVGGMVTVDGVNVRHIAGIVSLRDDSEDAFVPKKKPCYEGSEIHRIVKGGWIQGGELDARVMEVPECFPDESFSVPFSRRGVLAMARGDTHHTNATQFIVTLEKTPWMRCEYVAFGQLVEGEKVLRVLEAVDTYFESPVATVKITDCGVLTNPKAKPPPPKRRSTAKDKDEEEEEEEEGFPRVPTEIFVRNMLIAMMTDVATELNKGEAKKFLRQIRNAITVEALLEVMDAMAKTILTDMKKESKNQRRRLSQRRSMYGIAVGGRANFCGR